MKLNSDALRTFWAKHEVFIYHVFCILTTAILFSISLIRAASTAITYDEAFTYLHYSQSITGFLQIGLANNHPLNSFLIYAATLLTGLKYNELVIRLPNLLAYLLYLAIAVQISKRFHYKYLAFSLLCFFYFLNEFFGLARGYGISTALILTALFIYLRHEDHRQGIIPAMFFLLLACTSNFYLLVLFACFVLYTFIFDVSLPGLAVFAKRNWYFLAFQLIVCLGLGYIFLQVTQPGLPLFGSTGSFFEAVPWSFVRMLTSYAGLATFLAYGLLVCYVLVIIIFRTKILRQPFTVLLIAYFVITVGLAYLFKRPLPTERILLPIWPVLVLSLVELLEAFSRQLSSFRWQRCFSSIASILCLLLLVIFFSSIHLDYTTSWKDNYPVPTQMMKAFLKHDHSYHFTGDPNEQFYIRKYLLSYGIDLRTSK